MKIAFPPTKHRQAEIPWFRTAGGIPFCGLIVALGCGLPVLDSPSHAQTAQETASPNPASQPESKPESQPAAVALVDKVIDNLAKGPAFYAGVRESVFASKRDVFGIGSYEQAGSGTGQYHLQLNMHDGEGKHSLIQISDGRLAWTRTEIAGQITLRRVDVGRLNEWIPPSAQTNRLAPSLLVGGLTEMLAKTRRECSLQIKSAKLADRAVVVISASLKPSERQRIMAESGRGTWPELHPTRIQIAVATSDDPETGFGKGLPVRWEFRSDPTTTIADDGTATTRNGHLITLIELHSIRQIAAPSSEHFRYDNRDAEVNFVNDTDHYLNLYHVEITQSERRAMLR